MDKSNSQFYFWIAEFAFTFMSIIVIYSFTCNRLEKNEKWLSNNATGSLFALMNFLFPEMKNAFSGKECQKELSFACWCCWMLIHMQMSFLEFSFAQMRFTFGYASMFTLTKHLLTRMDILNKLKAKGVSLFMLTLPPPLPQFYCFPSSFSSSSSILLSPPPLPPRPPLRKQ